MDATTLAPDAPLPDDVATLHAMVRQLLTGLAKLRAENAELKTKLDAALKHRFGRRSERRTPPPVPTTEKPPPRRDDHGRAPLPEHLERREVAHDLTEAEKLCPCCGRVRACIGEQTAEQLDLEPATFFVLRTVKKSYACRHCDPSAVPAEQRIRTAGPAQVGPIAKGLCGPGLLAHVITAKFADRTPVHRLAGQLARSDVTIASSTLGDWLKHAAELLTPLYELMHTRLLLSRVIHGDDTGVRLRVPGSTRTTKAHLWACIGDADYPYVLYAVERALPPLLPPSDDPVQREQRRQREEERGQLRQRDAEPVWNEWSAWLAGHRPNVLPKSPLGTAVGYASNNWDALKRYLERGFLAPDNNLSERTLRASALGRNARGVIGSEVGGQTAAVLYSVVGTCKHLGIDPFAYLRDARPGLFARGEEPTAEQLLDWLPDRWRLNRARGQPIRDATGR